MVKISPDNITDLFNIYGESRETDLTCKLVGDHLILDIAKVPFQDNCILQRTNTAETTMRIIVGIL
ncbi:MAG TPA: hypothetical protein VJU13_06680 [Candidatus Nitrosocosmicus sp.]|nr:hypothetical protein [Candidatus Nitrosocosmicus sp.]